jgi:NAD(P)-dependent dehydrogenase (short-subunit alcohol dehydrogenase family)
MESKNAACLITGGTRGIGAAAAVAFAEHGANIVIVGRRLDDAAKDVVRQVEGLGRRCVAISADIGKPDEAARCVEQTIRNFGTIDLLVHSAGGPVNGGLLEITPEQWYSAFGVHVHPIFHLCRAAVPVMKKNRRGSIVLISSTAGIRGIRTNVAYQTVKGSLP